MAHKNNEHNLIPASERTPEERRRIAQKAGRASGRARKAKSLRTFKQMLMDDLTEEQMRAMLDAQVERAENGQLDSFSFLLKMAGQHPDQEPPTDNSIRITIQGGDDYGD